MFPTRNLSQRAAAHRAMARAALFADSSASTRLKRYNHHTEKARRLEAQAMPAFTIYLARTGERLEVHAETWQQAIKRTGRADACMVEAIEPGKYDLAFDPDCPFIVTDADLSRGLATVVALLDGAERGREVQA